MNKYAIDNARLAAHVSYLTDIVDIKDVVALPAATQVTPSEPTISGDVTEEK